MANERIVKITILGDAKSAQKSLTDLGKTAGETEVKVSGFGKAFAGIGASVASALVGFAAVSKAAGFVGSAIDEAAKGQQQLDQLGAVLKSTGGAAGVTAQQAIDLSKSLQELTTYSDQAVLGAENLLLTFTGIGKDIFPQTTQTVLDMSTAMGQDLKSSALQLGKALQDPVLGITALHDVGVNFTAQQVEQVKAMVAVGDTAGAQKLILAELNKEFGGSAQAAAKGYTGQVKQLTNQYNDLKEAIGTAALPALTDFTKALSNGAKSTEFQAFIGTLTHDLQALFSGNFFDEWLVSGHKAIFLLFDAFNKGLKDISGGRLNIDGLLGGMLKVIAGEESKIKASIDQHVVAPVAEGLSGKSSGSQIAPAKVQGYGAAVLASYIKGLTSAQVADFDKFRDQFKGLFDTGDTKADANAFAGASATLALALDELAKKGEVSNDTMLDLSSQFGLQVPEVYKLLQAYAAMGAAQDKAADKTAALAQAQGNLTRVTAQAANAAADADKVIAAAQATATQHSEAAAAALDAEQDALKGVSDAAAEAARGSAAAIDALQATAAAHAEENNRLIAEAQAAQTAASAQRQRDSAIAKAAIDGETEAYERQTEGLTEQDRQLASHYETIIGGERRAKDAADERLNGLNKAANKEDLDFLTRIQAARQGGHAKEANALQRQFDARKKVRGSEMEIARAQAAVAGDEYDTKVAAITKEEKARDEVDAKAETAAGQRLKEVQANADAQAKADAAAIKGVQDAAKAEADRYAAQQRGIQAEIDRLNDAAKVQAAKDAAAILAAQNLKTETALKWSIENTGATVALGLANQIADANERTAKAAKETYDHTKDTVDLHNANPAAFAPPVLSAPIGSAPNAGPDRGVGNTGGAPTTLALPPLIDATKARSRPDGYHYEMEDTMQLWFVADGYSLASYGKREYQGDNAAPGGNGGSDSLGRAGSSSLLAEGAPTAARAPGGDRGVTINIHAPNLTDLGSTAQQAALGASLRREWQQQARGGPGRAV